MASAGAEPLKGVAIVVGSFLNKLQAQRAFGDAVTVFTDMGCCHDMA